MLRRLPLRPSGPLRSLEFVYQRPPRWPLHRNTIHVKVNHRPEGYQNVPVQSVRLRKALFNRRNFVLGVITTAICLKIFDDTILSPLSRFLEQELDGAEEESEEEPEPLFIPFPFTTEKVQPPNYKGTDPEWQEYVKFSKEHKKQDTVKSSLCDLARRAADANPWLTRHCGRGFKVSKYWLHIVYPYRPPPVFIRSGVMLNADGSVEWATAPVDSATVFRLQRILWPSTLTLSMWSFTETLMKQHYLEFSKLIGGGKWSDTAPRKPGDAPPIEMPQQRHSTKKAATQTKAAQRHDGSTEGGEASGTGSGAGESRTTDKGDTAPPSPPHEAHQPDSGGQNEKNSSKEGGTSDQTSSSGSSSQQHQQKQRSPPPPPPGFGTKNPDDPQLPDLVAGGELLKWPLENVASSIREPSRSFWTRLRSLWRPVQQNPPRGSIQLGGIVQLETPTAWVWIDVLGFWDPKLDRFDPGSMKLGLRLVQAKQQYPVK